MKNFVIQNNTRQRRNYLRTHFADGCTKHNEILHRCSQTESIAVTAWWDVQCTSRERAWWCHSPATQVANCLCNCSVKQSLNVLFPVSPLCWKQKSSFDFFQLKKTGSYAGVSLVHYLLFSKGKIWKHRTIPWAFLSKTIKLRTRQQPSSTNSDSLCVAQGPSPSRKREPQDGVLSRWSRSERPGPSLQISDRKGTYYSFHKWETKDRN